MVRPSAVEFTSLAPFSAFLGDPDLGVVYSTVSRSLLIWRILSWLRFSTILLQWSSCPSPTPPTSAPWTPHKLECTSGHCSSQSCLWSPSWSHLPRYCTVTSVKSFLHVVIPRQSPVRETCAVTAWPCWEPVPPWEGSLRAGSVVSNAWHVVSA